MAKRTRAANKGIEHAQNTPLSRPSPHSPLLSIYLGAWRRVASWRTLLHVGLDLALIILTLVLYILNAGVVAQLASGLQPMFNAVQRLESGVATDLERQAILEQYKPDFNSLLVRAGFVTLAFYLAFIVLYAFFTTGAWNAVQRTPLSRQRFVRNLLLTGAWLLVLLGLPLASLLINPIAAALVFLFLFACTVLYLPLFYAASGQGWRTLFPDRSFKAVTLSLLAAGAFAPWLLITLVLLGSARFLASGILGSQELVPSLLLFLGFSVLLILSALALRIAAQEAWARMWRLLVLLLLLTLTFIAGASLASIAMLAATWLYAILIFAWLLLFFGLVRYAIDLEVRDA